MTRLNEFVVANAYGFPQEGTLVDGHLVSASGVDVDSGRWFVLFDGTVTKETVKKNLKPALGHTKYFRSGGGVYEVATGKKVKMETTRTNPSGVTQTVVSGSITSTRVRKNPVSVSEFRTEMRDMFVSDPRRDFKVIDSPKAHSPAFRDILFSFVSYRGESYGWLKGGKIYHRRGSLVMPKLKVNRAVEGSTAFYHTHPSKDEPSLSSADDYQFYLDLAFAFGIKHFYTVMENRIDHFQFTVKKSTEEDYLKMDEDKLLDDINAIIDGAEADISKKHKGDKNMPDEDFYAKMTAETVKRFNKRFSEYVTVKYKGHARPGIVRENPSDAGFRHNPPIRISHIHKASQLEELRDTTNNFEHYGANEYGHSQYVYWWVDHHFSLTPLHPHGRLFKLKELGLDDDTRRKLRDYMSEEVAPGYSHLDMLLLLSLYHDVGKVREKETGVHHSIIASEMFQNEIGPELGLPPEIIDACALLMLTDCGRRDITPEAFVTQAGDYLPVAYMLQMADMLAHHPFMFTSRASEAKKEGLIEKANVEEYKKKIARDHFANIKKFLDTRVKVNPPPSVSYIVATGSYETPIDGDLADEFFGEEWINRKASKEGLYHKGQLRLRDPESGLAFAVDVKNGNFRMYVKNEYFSEGDEFGLDTARDIYTRVGRILSEFTPGIRVEDIPEPEILVNPRHSKEVHVITVSGPSGVGKSTIARTLAHQLDAALIPTVTTRPKRPREKVGVDRVFVSEKKFREMIEAGELVEWKKQKNGHFYGRRFSDFTKPIAVVDVSLKGMRKYREAFPSTTTIFLDPDVTPDQLAKRILRRGGMTKEEAQARARIASKQIADAHGMDFDMYVKSKTGNFEGVAKQIADDIVLNNPPNAYGRALRQRLMFDDNPTLDTFMPQTMFSSANALSKATVVYRDSNWIVVGLMSTGVLASYSNMFRDPSNRLSTSIPGWSTSAQKRKQYGSAMSYKNDFPMYFIGKARDVWPTLDEHADGYAIVAPRTKNHYPAGEFRNGRNAEVGVKGNFDMVGRKIPEELFDILENVAKKYTDQELARQVNHLRTETPEYRTKFYMDRAGFVRVPGQPENKDVTTEMRGPEDRDWRVVAQERQEAAQRIEQERMRAEQTEASMSAQAERVRLARKEQAERDRNAFSTWGQAPTKRRGTFPASRRRPNPPLASFLSDADKTYIQQVMSQLKLVSPVVRDKDNRYMVVVEFPVMDKGSDNRVHQVGSARMLFYSRTGTGSGGRDQTKDAQFAESLLQKNKYAQMADSPFLHNIMWKKWGDSRFQDFSPLVWLTMLGYTGSWYVKPNEEEFYKNGVPQTTPRFPTTNFEKKFAKRRWGHRSMFYAGVALSMMMPDPIKQWSGRILGKEPIELNQFIRAHGGMLSNSIVDKNTAENKTRQMMWENSNFQDRTFAPLVNPKSRQEWFEDWAKLINMKNKELEAFLNSPLGKKAGLSASEAKEQGIHSGRVSGKAILRMRKKIGLGGPKDYIKGPKHMKEKFALAQKKWNDNDWEWCARQVRFNKRFMGDWMGKRKGPLVRDGQPTRRLLALWVWGFDPWRHARKVEKRKTMPKCPKVPWIGMTEKRMYGVQKNEVRMNPPVIVKSRKDDDLLTRFINPETGEELTGRWFDGGFIDTTQGSRPVATLGQEITDVSQFPEGWDRGLNQSYNIAKWGDRTVVQERQDYFEKVTINTPVFLLSDPVKPYTRKEPSAFFATIGTRDFSRDEYKIAHPGDITDFKGNAKGFRPAAVYKEVTVNPPSRDNPQTGLPGIGEPVDDPAEIAPHLDWPMWNAPSWVPRNLIPNDAVFVRPQMGEPYYHIKQEDLDTLLASQEYLQAQEEHRQRVLREAQERKEELRRSGQQFLDDFRTNPSGNWIHRGAVLVYKGKHRQWNNGRRGIEAGDVVRVGEIRQDFHSGQPITLVTLYPLESFIMKTPKAFSYNMVERDFEPVPETMDHDIPDHLTNPPNIPFPIPEEYQERLEKRLAHEMTQDGYRPLRVQQDFIDSGGYDDQPSDWSYVQGEYQEFLDEIEAQDWDEAYAEYSDVEGHTAYFLWTNYGIDMPVYTHGHIDKVLFRIRVFEDLFNHYGYEFGPEFLKGGSNYEKVFKARLALDAAADAQGKPRVKDDDEQLSAVVRSIVEVRKNSGSNNLSRDFERMKKMAYDVRSKELAGGFNGREWWNQQIPQIEERYGTEPLDARWLIPLDTTDFDPSDKSQEFDDDGVKPLHFLNQLKRIPMTKPPTPERIMQVALNIGQGQVHGIIPEDYGLDDFIAFNNPRTPGGKKFPTRYLTGLTKLEKMIAEDEIDKGYKYDADDPKAYEFWKSDIKATARGMKIGPSKHRIEYYKRYRKNIDKDYKPSGNSPKRKFINRIVKETGIKRSIIEKIYDKGLAAWRVGHRPGVQQHQWAAGRVYAFVVGADSSTGPGKPDHKLAVEAGVRKK